MKNDYLLLLACERRIEKFTRQKAARVRNDHKRRSKFAAL